MSLFGGKKTYVASTSYNLAGDEADRPDYLKTMVVGSVIGSDAKSSTGDAIRTGYLNGPSIKLRGYYRWAEDHYNSTIGLTASGLAGAPNINPSAVAAAIGGSISLQMVRSGLSDYEIWAEQWVLNNYPDQLNSAWSSDYSDTSNQVTVTMPDASVHTFTPGGFVKGALYIYATYNQVSAGGSGPPVSGGVIPLAPGDPFPSTSGWATDSFTSTEHTTPTPWTESHGVYSKTGPTQNDGTGRIYVVKSVMKQDQTGPSTRTYEVTTQETTVTSWSPLKVFIYRVGSGNAALDNQVSAITNVGGFFPPIPVRLDNKFISESYLPTQYEAAQKAYKKLTAGGKFDELVTKLKDNESLADIDYAFVVPGVSLNAKENSCRKYLYEFFAGAMLTSVYDEIDYGNWSTGVDAASGAMSAWKAWLDAQGTGGPLDGTPQPARPAYGSAARNEIRVSSSNATLGYDTRISWKAIKEEIGTGLAKAGAKVGEVWLQKGGVFSEAGPSFSGGIAGLIYGTDSASEDLLIYWQTSLTSWRRLTVRGLVHQNYIYKGKYVEIKAHEALDDAEESGFIVPIHYETWHSMSIRDTTQMSTACVFLVLNSYQVVKKKWYQTGIFKIVLFIVVVVVSVITFGAATPGLLGTAAAVGASLGFTGLVAVIVGTIANTLAAMILAKMITAASMAILGDRIGLIVGLIASFAALQIGVGLQNGLSMADTVAQMANPMSLLSLTNSVGQGVSGIIQMDAQDTLAKTQDVLSDYAKQSKSISELYEQNIGHGRGMIDPTMLTNSGQWFVEAGDTFLARTLMTGSDIAELSMSLLSDFSDLTLSTELPL